MCTVTYVPAPDGFVLTHNRDEAPYRSSKEVSETQNGSKTLIYPRDTKAGGTWIATTPTGEITVCLLNGAFEKHHHEPPYRRSRGLVLLDFLDVQNTQDFYEHYDLQGIEPFTLLAFSLHKVEEFRWDGIQRHLKNLPYDQTHFWCSATLYPAPMRARREQVFRDWLPKHPHPTPDDLLALHQNGQVGDPENDFVMNRAEKVKTVSITQVVYDSGRAHLKYLELGGEQQTPQSHYLCPQLSPML